MDIPHDLRLKTFNVWNAEHYSYIDGRSENRTSLICMITKSNKEDVEFCAKNYKIYYIGLIKLACIQALRLMNIPISF